MTIEQYENRKKSLEKMKELHKNDPYVLSYLIDIERNWEDALKADAKADKTSRSVIGGPLYRY